MKKIIIIFCIVGLSLFEGFSNYSFIINVELIIPFLFTIFGLCLTAYTFIYAPITEILRNKNVQNDKLEKLLNSFEEDMKLIFFLTIVIIIVDFVKEINFPGLKDALNIDLGMLKIKSLKLYFFKFIVVLNTNFSFYALYDLMQATFKILRNSFNK